MTQVTAGATSSNFFLDGNFSPVAEERDAEDMTVIGTIPKRPGRSLPSSWAQPCAYF